MNGNLVITATLFNDGKAVATSETIVVVDKDCTIQMNFDADTGRILSGETVEPKK